MKISSLRTLVATLFSVSLIFTCSPTFAQVGKVVENFELKDFQGRDYSLQNDFADSELVVVAFVGTECPLVKLYSARLQELSEQYSAKQVQFVAVDSLMQDSVTEIASWARRHGLTVPVLKDPAQVVADAFGAERTPHVFVLDQNRVIRYSGRIDDQYVVGVVRDKSTRQDLKIAIDELLAGQAVSIKKTEPLGCLIARAQKPNEKSSVTYSNQISRIFQKNCVNCHREGEIAPFPLESYSDVIGWGPMIAEVVNEQRMPPWHANPKHGEFANDCSLTAEEKQLINLWVKNGSPEGDPAQLPEPETYIDGWQLPHAPDVVFEMADKPFKVAANAGPRGIPYQRFWVDPQFTEDQWVIGAEARPGNRAVVHHIIVYVHPNGKNTPEHGFFCAYVPGLRIQERMPGVGKKIPAGSALRFEMHYTPIGTEQEDLSTVGFIFGDPEEITHEVKTLHVVNARFELKPHQDNQVVKAQSRKSPASVKLLSMSPHMHLRGKSFRYEAEYPDGRREVLLDVPQYDFNWQTQYRLKEPLEVPVGMRLVCTAAFDNSESNLANPDPSATVRWGDQSWDEMMLGYYEILLPVDRSDSVSQVERKLLNVDVILKLVDKNGDKDISREEAKPHPIISQAFDKIDLDRNGTISSDELTKVVKHLRERRGL